MATPNKQLRSHNEAVCAPDIKNYTDKCGDNNSNNNENN